MLYTCLRLRFCKSRESASGVVLTGLSLQDAASSSLPTAMAQLPSTTCAKPSLQSERSAHIPARLSGAVALAHWTGRSDQVEVPQALAPLHSVFWLHPTPITAVCFILGLIVHRWGQGPVGVLECGGEFTSCQCHSFKLSTVTACVRLISGCVCMIACMII